MIRSCLVLIYLLFLLPVYAPAQNATSVDQGDLARMIQSLDELIQLLKSQKSRDDRVDELQKLEVAVSYLNFRSRRIEAKEQELQEKRNHRLQLEGMLAKVKAQLEQREEAGDNYQNSQPISSSYKQGPSDSRLKQYQQRIDTLESEIITLEIVINDLFKELAEIETFVEKNLKLIP